VSTAWTIMLYLSGVRSPGCDATKNAAVYWSIWNGYFARCASGTVESVSRYCGEK